MEVNLSFFACHHARHRKKNEKFRQKGRRNRRMISVLNLGREKNQTANLLHSFQPGRGWPIPFDGGYESVNLFF